MSSEGAEALGQTAKNGLADSEYEQDRIELRGLRIVATHGVLPHEKAAPQPFEIDIDLAVDTARSQRTDDLSDTADYSRAVLTAVELATAKSHQLLESLAADIAQALLEDALVLAATVTVRKLRPPLPFDVASAAVRVTRRRA
jgi:dihydroneopterin aldolase